MNLLDAPATGWSSQWEHNVYAQGRQTNRYPYTEVVSLVHRFVLPHVNRSAVPKPRALEVGCGAGPNLVFLARAGFEVFGVDGSATAVEVARQHLESQGAAATLHVHDFARSLPFPDASLDLVLDRASLPHNRLAAIRRAFEEIRRVLRPGGFFVSVGFFSTVHGAAGAGTEIEANTWTDLPGTFEGTGVVHFTTQSELLDLLAGLRLLHLVHHISDVLVPVGSFRAAAFNLVARMEPH